MLKFYFQFFSLVLAEAVIVSYGYAVLIELQSSCGSKLCHKAQVLLKLVFWWVTGSSHQFSNVSRSRFVELLSFSTCDCWMAVSIYPFAWNSCSLAFLKGQAVFLQSCGSWWAIWRGQCSWRNGRQGIWWCCYSGLKATVGTFSTKRVQLSEVKYLQQLILETGCILESVKCPQQIQAWELCTAKDLLICYLFTTWSKLQKRLITGMLINSTPSIAWSSLNSHIITGYTVHWHSFLQKKASGWVFRLVQAVFYKYIIKW